MFPLLLLFFFDKFYFVIEHRTTTVVDVPVIAVPTSIGYGVSLGGISAMLTMLNSCAPGVGVVNIDNGFGAAALAYKFLRSHQT